jgi:hypothetical protein
MIDGLTGGRPVARHGCSLDGQDVIRIRGIDLVSPLRGLDTDRRDRLAGADERPVQETVGVVMRNQERFDPAPQLLVGLAFAVEDVVAIGQVFLLDGRQEYGLDTFRVERHGEDLVLGSIFHALFAAVAVEKNGK